jgi:uncharacterized protein
VFEYNKLMWARATAVLLVALTATLPVGCGGDESGTRVTVGGQEIRAEVADTPEERVQGLSGRAGLDSDEGMLFELPAASRQAIWMKDMRFPIDIVWIANGRVSEVSARVSAPRPGTSESELPLYRPQNAVDRILEVSSGWAARNDVGPGDAVTVSR